MEITEEYSLEGEGWGLCLAQGTLYQSDGSSRLILRSPETFEPADSVEVTLNGQPQVFINELEYAYGYILANQWRTARILFINPENGVVERVINLRNVIPDNSGVMNGLAADETGKLFCSGKNWPVTIVLEGIL